VLVQFLLTVAISAIFYSMGEARPRSPALRRAVGDRGLRS
jgi:hypothetical protein